MSAIQLCTIQLDHLGKCVGSVLGFSCDLHQIALLSLFLRREMATITAAIGRRVQGLGFRIYGTEALGYPEASCVRTVVGIITATVCLLPSAMRVGVL